MIPLCALVLASACADGDGLDEARSLLRRGLLRETEVALAPLLADESNAQQRAHALLLLGNVDYERGSYGRALESYVQAERAAVGDPSLLAAISGNRVMAEQRLSRHRDVAALATRLRWALGATLALAGAALAWLARGSREA